MGIQKRLSVLTILFAAQLFAVQEPEAQAGLSVAFFSQRDHQGRIVQYEQGGRFSHVALSYRGRWLHVSTTNGVELIDSLEMIRGAEIAEILTDHRADELDAATVEKLLGLPYDTLFRWEDEGSTYCSKLAGTLLGIEPTPMTFTGNGWSFFRGLPRGQLGLSPEDVYAALIARGFKRLGESNCGESLQ